MILDPEQRRMFFNAAWIGGLVSLCAGALSVGIVYGKLSTKDEAQESRLNDMEAKDTTILSRIDLAISAVQASAQRLEMHEYRIGKTEQAIQSQQETAEELKRGIEDVMREVKKP